MALFHRRKGGVLGVVHGYKGKGILFIFLLTLMKCHCLFIPLQPMKMKGSMSARSLRLFP